MPMQTMRMEYLGLFFVVMTLVVLQRRFFRESLDE